MRSTKKSLYGNSLHSVVFGIDKMPSEARKSLGKRLVKD